MNLKSTIIEGTYHYLMEKKCSKCEVTKSLDCYHKDRTTKDGYKFKCKECALESVKQYADKNRDVINAKKTERRKDPKVKEKEAVKYKEYYHKPEVKKRYKEYRNIPEVKKRYEDYRNDPINKEKKKQQDIENRSERNEKKNKKYATNINFRLRALVASRLHKALTRNKKSSTLEYLGCDINFLKQWLEFRFDENTSWDNFGSYWEIDHILPVYAFDLADEKQINICFHWTNLQPLKTSENRSKFTGLHLHYYFNNIVNVNRFNSKFDRFLGYQAVNESLQWLKKKDFRYGKNPSDDNVLQNTLEMDNPQPSS